MAAIVLCKNIYVVSLAKGNAKVNLFKINTGYSIPVVHATGNTIEVILKGIHVGKDYIIEVFHPGENEPILIHGRPAGDEYILSVPVKRKCAMVHLKRV